MKMRKRGALAAATLGLVVLTGCSSVNTNSDEQGVAYDAGTFSDTSFDECVEPGTQEFYGPGDLTYVYPAGTRTYTFDEGGDRAAIDIVDRDGQPLTVAGILTFTLPSECEVLQQFHERIGLKYGASSDGVQEWGSLLNDYLGQPLRAAMRDAANDFTWRELYSDAAKQDEFAATVRDALPGYVEDLAGGDYFTGFTLLPQAPQPGPALLQQIEEQNTQTERLNTIEAQRLALDAERQQIEELVRILGPDGYIAYRNQLQCEANSESCVPYLPIPQGSDIVVSPGG